MTPIDYDLKRRDEKLAKRDAFMEAKRKEAAEHIASHLYTCDCGEQVFDAHPWSAHSGEVSDSTIKVLAHGNSDGKQFGLKDGILVCTSSVRKHVCNALLAERARDAFRDHLGARMRLRYPSIKEALKAYHNDPRYLAFRAAYEQGRFSPEYARAVHPAGKARA